MLRASKEFVRWCDRTRVDVRGIFEESADHASELIEAIPSLRSALDYSEYPIYNEGLDRAESLLDSMIREVKEYGDDDRIKRVPVTGGAEHLPTRVGPMPSTLSSPLAPPATGDAEHDPKRVFIVHGRDMGAAHTVARFLERVAMQPIILHEQPNEGRTVIGKFEDHADVGFAVILLTPDDEGRLREETDGSGALNPRARQNVLLELGFFLGKLGRERTCAIKKGEVEIPSDYEGVVLTVMDDAGAWKKELARELKRAGMDLDLNRLPEA